MNVVDNLLRNRSKHNRDCDVGDHHLAERERAKRIESWNIKFSLRRDLDRLRLRLRERDLSKDQHRRIVIMRWVNQTSMSDPDDDGVVDEKTCDPPVKVSDESHFRCLDGTMLFEHPYKFLVLEKDDQWESFEDFASIDSYSVYVRAWLQNNQCVNDDDPLRSHSSLLWPRDRQLDRTRLWSNGWLTRMALSTSSK